MDKQTQEYCNQLVKSGNYSQCFLNEAMSKYCPNLESLKRVVRTRNLTTVKPFPNR